MIKQTKKSIKQIFALLLTVVMVFIFMPFCVSAAGFTVKVKAEKTEVNIGEIINIAVDISEVPNNIYSAVISLDLSYDLELISANIISGSDKGILKGEPVMKSFYKDSLEGLVACDFTAGDHIQDGTFIEAKVKILENALDVQSITAEVGLGGPDNKVSDTVKITPTHIHNYINKVEKKYLKAKSTCTKPAEYFKSCSICDEISEETFYYGVELGHTPSPSAIMHFVGDSCDNPTSYDEVVLCSTCGKTLSSVHKVGEKLSHNYIENEDKMYLKSAADCVNAAVYYKSCSNCGKKSNETFSSNNIHDYIRVNSDDVCKKCQHIRIRPECFNVYYPCLIEYGDKVDKSKISVSYKDKRLIENVDYSLNIDDQDTKVLLNFYFNKEYDNLQYKYEIDKKVKDLSNAIVTVENSDYTGKPTTPNVTVVIDNKVLIKDKDYSVTYLNNTKGIDFNGNHGQASVIITGIGDYRGSVEKHFDILVNNYTKSDSVRNGDKSSVTIVAGTLELPVVKSYTVSNSSGSTIESLSYAPAPGTYKKLTFPSTGTYFVTYYTQNSKYLYMTANGTAHYEYTGSAVKHTVTVYYSSLYASTELPTGISPVFKEIDYKSFLLSVEANNKNADLDGKLWSSSNDSVATVDTEKGVVSLISPGTTNIVARSHGKTARYKIKVEALNISEKGKILNYSPENDFCEVEYDGQILREGVDYTKEILPIGETSVLTIKGINLFDGELKEIYYANTGNIYCSQKARLSRLPEKTVLKRYNDDLDLSGIKAILDLNGQEMDFEITEDMISGYDKTKLGEQKVTITIYSARTSFNVIVIDYIKGDTNGDEVITDQDAIYLLFSYYFPDKYPVEQPCDFNNDGEVTDQDAIYLLFHYYFPDKYPIE